VTEEGAKPDLPGLGVRPANKFARTQERPSFVVECAHRPLLAFAAASLAAAQKLCRQQWFADELAIYRTGDRPLWNGKDKLTVRPATPAEHAEVLFASAADAARGEDTKFVFAFLVPIDPIATSRQRPFSWL
jgi:hypothetical protein